MNVPFPQHTENIKTGTCCRCGELEQLVAHYGPQQEIKVCWGCDQVLWVERIVAPACNFAGGLVLRAPR